MSSSKATVQKKNTVRKVTAQKIAVWSAVACGLVGALTALLVGHGVVAEDGAQASVSQVILPTSGASALRFDHALQAHREQKCERCHVGATQSRQAQQNLLPRERSCNPCHASQTRVSESGEQHAGASCRTCHVEPPSTRVSVRANIKFSHAAHAQASLRCFDCHADINRSDPPERRHMPTMESCLGCHGGASASTTDACTTCHLAQGKKMKTRFGSSVLTPPDWLWGMGHDSDFLVRHRWVAADQGAACASCHDESECIDCHDGRVRSTRVHPHGFLNAHATAAVRNNPNCASCHAAQRFCTECHARLGLSPLAAPRARLGAQRFHPPQEVWTEGPALHGVEAQRSLQACVSCHREEDCIDCHGSAQTGRRGISPHPPSFSERCESMARANPRACVSCHGRAQCR